MRTAFRQFVADDSGATGIEYGLIAGLLSIGIITALTSVGASMNTMWTAVSSGLTSAIGPSS